MNGRDGSFQSLVGPWSHGPMGQRANASLNSSQRSKELKNQRGLKAGAGIARASANSAIAGRCQRTCQDFVELWAEHDIMLSNVPLGGAHLPVK